MTAVAEESATEEDDNGGRRFSLDAGIRGTVLTSLLLLLIFASYQIGQLGRLYSITWKIVAVVTISAAVFAGANVLVSQARRNWATYRALAGGLLGLAGFGLLRGNRSVGTLISDPEYLLVTDDGSTIAVTDQGQIDAISAAALPQFLEYGNGFLGLVEWPILGAILGAIAGFTSGHANRVVRLAVPTGIGVFAGWLISANLLFRNRPDASLLTIIVVAIIGAALLAGVSYLFGKHEVLIERALMGAAIGALVGGWFVPDLGTGSSTTALFACVIPLALLGVRFGWPQDRTSNGLASFDRRARAVIFLGPALTFLSVNLVVPAIRTIYTSFLDRDSEDFVGLDNYSELVSSENFLDWRQWERDTPIEIFGFQLTDIPLIGGAIGDLAVLSSSLTWIGLFLIIAGFGMAYSINRTRNGTSGFEHSPTTRGSMLLGGFLLAFAFFTVIRGTFSNTIWWMFTVTIVATGLGLAMAVLSQRAGRWENVAKSLVFMPMAISMVGASVIWRFQYAPKNISGKQTGALNAIWVELGNLSQAGVDGSDYPAWPRYLVLLVLGAILARVGFKIVGAWQRGESFAGSGIAAILVGYLFVELFRRSLGGFEILDDNSVQAQTIAFREEVRPFNNVYLMFILIWIQTGFAMVILSAAIKAVPEELLEAARIDGASESEQFFNVTLPQILPTVGVVLTTILVAVAKVFDIVRVSTGGNFGTNVLAHDFITESFQFLNRGVGSAIAVVILLIVAPVLIFNVYNMQRAES
ncbi:MAG: sugar ABC transporter permease [Actinomycetota bacterium]